jgi:ankyrin repeat protein
MRIVRSMARLCAAGVLGGVAAGAIAAQAPNEKQVSSFFRAVQMDDASTVRKMVGAVVNANELNPLGGEPALVLAIREGSTAVVQDLLAHPGTDLERKAVNGNTALMMAAFKRDGDTVRALLDKGAKVNQPGWTALHYAAASGDAAIAQLLIERGAQVNALSPRPSGAVTPLMMAAREGQDGIVRLLLAKGANAALKNTEGFTAAQLAKQAGHDKLAGLLSGR